MVSFFLMVLAACASGPETASTLTPVSAATIIPTSLPAISDDVLPHTLTYLRMDDAGIQQVFRMARDGKTVTQITSEPVDVTDYDISRVDGGVAYVANNQLLLVNADGSNRRLLVDGGPRDEDNPAFFSNPLTDPVFSPDGRTIAYAQGGLNLYDLSAHVSSLVIENQLTDPHPDGMRFPIETYSPERYSPDGTKLLVALGHWESPPTHAVYLPGVSQLVRYAEVQDYINCCSYHGGPMWSPDSSSFYGVASVHDTCCLFGELWKVNAGSGAVTRMLRTGSGTVNLAKEPYLAPNGQLYFFFGAYQAESGYWDAPVLELVRSAPEDMTKRTVLRDENFVLMQEALWAPDASLVIMSIGPARNWHRGGGVLELYYTDGQKNMVWLAPSGQQMKWGP